MKTKNIIQGVILTLLLFVIPGLSWYWLDTGMEYQKESRAEMKEYGEIQDFNLLDHRGEPTSLPEKGKSVVVSNIFNKKVNAMSSSYQWLKQIQKQFNNRSDVLFLSFINLDSTQNVKTLAKELKIEDGDQWKLIDVDMVELMQMRKDLSVLDSFNIPESNMFWLADTSRTIRRYYDSSKTKDMERLIEHISYSMPNKEKSRKE